MRSGNLEKQLPHLTNEMLENSIDWWLKCTREDKDNTLLILINEKLNRMLTYELCD